MLVKKNLNAAEVQSLARIAQKIKKIDEDYKNGNILVPELPATQEDIDMGATANEQIACDFGYGPAWVLDDLKYHEHYRNDNLYKKDEVGNLENFSQDKMLRELMTARVAKEDARKRPETLRTKPMTDEESIETLLNIIKANDKHTTDLYNKEGEYVCNSSHLTIDHFMETINGWASGLISKYLKFAKPGHLDRTEAEEYKKIPKELLKIFDLDKKQTRGHRYN